MKSQALDKFCTRLNYESDKLEGETKEQFLERRKYEWSCQVVEAQVIEETKKSIDISAEVENILENLEIRSDKVRQELKAEIEVISEPI